MAKYEITTIKSGKGEIPQELQILETVQVDSISATTIEQITTLLWASKRQFILKSRNGWQHMTAQFVDDLAPSVRKKTTTFEDLAALAALAAARKIAASASPFRPRRKDSPKSSKKVSKKSGKGRKNKKSKKSRN